MADKKLFASGDNGQNQTEQTNAPQWPQHKRRHETAAADRSQNHANGNPGQANKKPPTGRIGFVRGDTFGDQGVGVGIFGKEKRTVTFIKITVLLW